MGVTHVIRGDDHINNTPRQILIYRALGFEVPRFGHVPLIHGKDKARLSKRHGAASLLEYREEGFLAEALMNYLARLGWAHGDEEIFSSADLVEKFDLSARGEVCRHFRYGQAPVAQRPLPEDAPARRDCPEARPFHRKDGVRGPRQGSPAQDRPHPERAGKDPERDGADGGILLQGRDRVRGQSQGEASDACRQAHPRALSPWFLAPSEPGRARPAGTCRGPRQGPRQKARRGDTAGQGSPLGQGSDPRDFRSDRDPRKRGRGEERIKRALSSIA